MSLKVIETGAIPKLGCDFLFALFYSLSNNSKTVQDRELWLH